MEEWWIPFLRLSTVMNSKWACTLNIADFVQNQPAAATGKWACILPGGPSTRYLGRATVRPGKRQRTWHTPGERLLLPVLSLRRRPRGPPPGALPAPPPGAPLPPMNKRPGTPPPSALPPPATRRPGVPPPGAPPPPATRRPAPPAHPPIDAPLALATRRPTPLLILLSTLPLLWRPGGLLPLFRRPGTQPPCSSSRSSPRLSRSGDLMLWCCVIWITMYCDAV
jgi:hypothetical protein